jgi:RNase H-fold protein (predicted Holliday junction resolvase)
MTSASDRTVLAIDPGRSKCGVAVCRSNRVLAHQVVLLEALAGYVRDCRGTYGVTEVVVGDRTGADAVERLLADVIAEPLRRVDEAGTTLRARERYFKDHPPRGWRRLIPRGMLTPPEPYDDYAAILMAEAALAG